MGHYRQYSGNHPRFSKREEERYDADMAHDKNLTASARLHYLENDETHHPAKEMNYAVKEMDYPVRDGHGNMDMPVQNFKYVASQAKKAGDKSFEYAGETYPVKESRELSDMPIPDIEKGKAEGDIDKAVREYDRPNKMIDDPVKRYGAMKGDQSATHVDYANYKGTDKGYHGHSGSSHGDQSATHRDYLKGNVSHPAKEHGQPHGPAMEKAGRPAILRHCSPGHK